MAEPPVPEELAFEIPTESVIDLHMHWHGVLYCRESRSLAKTPKSERWTLNVDVSTRRNKLKHRHCAGVLYGRYTLQRVNVERSKFEKQ